MNPNLERALALARGDIAPPARPDLAKGGGAPSGFQPVPGGKHGGYRKQVGGKWQYWYPDAASVQQDRMHHADEANRHGVAHERAVNAGDTAARNEHHTAASTHNEVSGTLRDWAFAAERLPGSKAPRPGALGANAHARMVEDHARVTIGGESPADDAPAHGFEKKAHEEDFRAGHAAGAAAHAENPNVSIVDAKAAHKRVGAKHGTMFVAGYAGAVDQARGATATDHAQTAARLGLGPSPARKSLAQEPAMNRIALALAIARGDIPPAQADAMLAKSRAAREEADDDALIKAGSDKPPSGYVAVPGTAHGGFRKKTARGYSYWYPDTTSAHAAAQHHAGEAKKHTKDASDADRAIAGPIHHASGASYGGARGAAYHEAVGKRDTAKRAAAEHAEHAAGAVKFVEKQTATRRIMDEHADKKKRQAESAALPAEAPEGHHYISHGSGIKVAVPTVAKHGLYAVHGEGVKDGFARDGKTNSKASYTVTHLPTGMNVGGNTRTKADAIATAKHWHEHAGDAGKDAKHGEQPDKASMDKMRTAYEKLAAKKSAAWQPINATPDQLGIDLSKGLSVPSADRGIVRQDAFAGIKPAQPKRGGGDIMLKGIGAGFDPRWNGDSGFGG